MRLLTDIGTRSCLGADSCKHSPGLRRAAIGACLIAWAAYAHPTSAMEVRTCNAASGAKSAALVELFTSQGCSSCPPADRWLAELGRSKANIVPLAFHVDYWNYLGWEDPYAMPQFTQRQHRYAAYARTRTIYTPQVFLNGRELGAWRTAQADKFIPHASAALAPIRIALRLQPQRHEDMRIDATVTGDIDVEDMDLYLAVYENQLSNKVGDGENAGHTLHHNHVTRRLLGPIALMHDSPARHDHVLHIEREWRRANLGVAAFVQRRSDGAVLQAVSLPLCF